MNFITKLFMPLLGVLIAAYKKVCGISDADSRAQELVLFVIFTTIILGMIGCIVWFGTNV